MEGVLNCTFRLHVAPTNIRRPLEVLDCHVRLNLSSRIRPLRRILKRHFRLHLEPAAPILNGGFCFTCFATVVGVQLKIVVECRYGKIWHIESYQCKGLFEISLHAPKMRVPVVIGRKGKSNIRHPIKRVTQVTGQKRH